MDRLVKVDVKEIEIFFKKNEKCKADFKLTNVMHTMPVAVSLKTTSNSSFFSFSQPFSIIPPLSSLSYTVFFASSHHPPLTSPPDQITVRSATLPTGKAHADSLRCLFLNPGRHVFKDASLLISFTGPHVAEFIVSSYRHRCSRFPEVDFLFGKAVSGCTVSQLTVLMEPAVLSGNLVFIETLIDAGGDVNVKDSRGRSMISLAVQTGGIEAVKRLVESTCEIDRSVDFVLHFAAAMNRVDLIEILLLHESLSGTGVNSVDSDGRTPIHIAAVHGHTAALGFCVAIGGDPEAVDLKKWTALHCAAAEGNIDAVKHLLECSNVKYAVNSDGKTAFDLASDNGHVKLLDSLGNGDVLYETARNGDVRELKNCLRGGTEVDGKDQNGWTALHRAAFKGRIECVEALIENGAKVDAFDDNGNTPLRFAIDGGHEDVAFFLLLNGAKPKYVGRVLNED